ncbi:hypothetical protein CP258_03735 [Corynebacterium pseudotuberculosis 258]|uniref:Transposase n=1 Tax=Corynebacterium pseudotuberculosis 258 TaxID=1168865 RepID=A0AAX1FKB5_CORPS|nr:hypothetical protein CP258_03735 [Corynebacterium pseudotuberculosis 258]QGW57451.1 hypothetical protein CPCIP5297_03740 [Corynebacterium pseudotuberculosis CIP 52.97]
MLIATQKTSLTMEVNKNRISAAGFLSLENLTALILGYQIILIPRTKPNLEFTNLCLIPETRECRATRIYSSVS